MSEIVAVLVDRVPYRSGARTPIGRRKDDGPKMWSGLIKLKCHRGIPSLGSLDANHAAALLRFGLFVDKEDGLAGLNLHAQPQQPAVRIDHHGLRFFAHLFAVPGPGLHDNGNLQHHTLAAPAICWVWVRHSFSLGLVKTSVQYTSRHPGGFATRE